MSKAVPYTCPHCGGEMTHASEHKGMASQCPFCQQEIILSGPTPKLKKVWKLNGLTWGRFIFALFLLYCALWYHPVQEMYDAVDEGKLLLTIGFTVVISIACAAITAGVIFIPFAIIREFRQGNANLVLQGFGVLGIRFIIGLVFATALCIGIFAFQKLTALPKSKGNPIAVSQAPNSAAADQPILQLTIKGFYIGMTLAEVQQTVQTKLGSHWGIFFGTENTQYPTKIEIVPNDDISPSLPVPVISVRFDSDGKVNYILIEEGCSNLIFNAQDLTARQFAQKFADSYDIPTMTPKSKFYEYYDDNAKVLVRVGFDKTVFLKKVTDRDTLTPNFN